MMQRVFPRLKKEDKPVLAICYDFDKTLTPENMQAQGFIESIHCDEKEFWKESNELAFKNDMDLNLAYMYLMCNKALGQFYLTKATLADYGAKIKLYDGVKEWFSRINEYGKSRGVIVEHYILSSGLKEMIEGTEIAKEFKAIYASSFYFNDKGYAEWPAQAINYTNKTQFLFRIQKGCLNINDHNGVNEYIRPENIRVPFRDIVYIGDSETDVPCMKLVNTYGGYAIGVYDSKSSKDLVHKMMKNQRIKYYAEADYREGSKLEELIKMIINRTEVNEKMETLHNELLANSTEMP